MNNSIQDELNTTRTSQTVHGRLVRLGAALVAGTLLWSPAQAQTPFKQEVVEVSGFLGSSPFLSNNYVDHLAFLTGGFRVSENPWKKFGLEQTFAWSASELEFYPPQYPVPITTPPAQSLYTRNFRFSLDGLYHFTERGSRFRPFVNVGVGGTRNKFTSETRDFIPAGLIPPGQVPHAQTFLQYNYGGGVKIRMSNLVSIRGDVRGLNSVFPTYGLSTFPNGGAFIPAQNRGNSMEYTFGIGFNFGSASTGSEVQAIPTITVDPPTAAVESQGVLVNTPVRFKGNYDNPKNKKLAYKWTVNGQPAGDNSDTLSYTPTSPATYNVGLQVSEANGKNPANANPVSIYAKLPPPPPPPVAHNLTVGTITADPASSIVGVPGASNGSLTGLNATNSIGAGTPVRLSATATDTLNHPLTYTWLVNGTQAGTGNPYTYTPATPGWYRVELRVSDNQTPPSTATATAPVTIYARDTRPPTATACNATTGTLIAGQTTGLSMTGTVAQGNTLRIQWTASEGAITNPTSAQATFNSASVNFPANPQVQTKTITATATVTDDSGATASCSTTIRVSTDPQAVHYGDILFSANSARVDNAAKRVLMERVYPELTGAYQGYTLALVGHTDRGERRNLDRDRVRNSAAVLTAGQRSCLALEPSRVQTSSIGQTDSEYKDASGLASTAGSRINRDDPRSRNRRVEIWLVPAGKPMPSVMQNPQVLTPDQLRGIGCPR